jgi:hypothetical protein
LACTPEIFFSTDDLSTIADRYDVLIAGSDQVWNPRWLEERDGFFDLYFLSFAGERTKRISYAASIGHSDASTMTDAWQSILSEKLTKMDSISVREASSVPLVKFLSGRTDAVQVVDPTLLLDRSHYDEIATPIRGAKYLFSYMLHGMEKDSAMLGEALAAHFGLSIRRCDAVKTCLDRGYHLPAPPGWLGSIRDASFMITNSFHGVVFCLIFHVPFLAVLISGPTGSMNSRIVELLEGVSLLHRIVSPGDEVPMALYDDSIDWNRVDAGMEALRDSSIEFLMKQGI